MGALKLDQEKERLKKAEGEAEKAIYFARARLEMIRSQIKELEQIKSLKDLRPEPELT